MNFARQLILLFGLFIISGGCYDNANKKAQAESLIQISPDNLKVGEETIVTITVTAPEGGIAVGGGTLFPFYMKPWNGLIKGISEDKTSNTLVSVTRSDGGKIMAENILTNPQWEILSDLKILIQETPLPERESIIIQFGNDIQHVNVGRKQLSFFLEAELDANGNGEYTRMIPPLLPIAESDPVKLYLVAPAYTVSGEEFEVVIYGEDEKLNVCEAYEAQIEVSLMDSNNEEIIHYQMHKWDPEKDLDRNSFSYAIKNNGIYYLHAIDNKRGLTAFSNPIIVSDKLPEQNLYWGEVHVHSQLSDGRGELQDVYRDGYARGLDFVAITDHGFGRKERGTLEERIQEICREADRFNRPGEFVAIPAGETHYLPVMHMNMFFDVADPDKILTLANSIDEVTKDLRKNWRNMNSEELAEGVIPYWDIFKNEVHDKHSLVFPHHTMWLGIKPFIDAERTRVIEVYSVHGTSEIRDQENTPKSLQMKPDRIKGDQDQKFSAREMLNDGIKLGFVGGSDNHEGQAGYNAITGVYVNELNRKSIIQGIYNKKCYATSSNRTLIQVDQINVGFSCVVAGDGDIDVVQVIYNGEISFERKHISGRIYEFEWSPPEPRKGYFYIKAILEDGHEAAWSSPIWVD
jgi:hypothetical protein